jgi:putative peptidoglycan lipid II flippase
LSNTPPTAPTEPPGGEENQPNVARAGGIMMLSLFLSRVLGIVRDQAMLWTFGMTIYTDAYRWAFQIPDLMFFLIAGGALSSAFIPVFSEYLHTGREEDAWKVFSVVVTVMSLVVLAFILLAAAFAPELTRLVVPFDRADQVRPLIAHMSRILLPTQFAFFIGGIMFGTLYARQRFAVPGLGPNIYNLGIILGAVVLSQFFSPGVIGMAWGALLGACVGNLLIPMLAMRGIGVRFKPSLDTSHPGVRKVFRLMLPVVLGLSLPGVYGLIMQALSSAFQAGTATALDVANRLMQAPLGIFGQSLAIAVFPALSQFFAQNRMADYSRQLSSTLRTVVYITVPISTLMLILAPDVVTVLYQYGTRFQEAEAARVADALRMFALGITAWCLHPVLMRGFFAIQTTTTPIVLGTVTTLIFGSLAWAFIQTPLGYLGLPLASSLSAMILAAMLLASISRKVEDLDVGGLATTIAKAVVAALPMAAVLIVAVWIVPAGEGIGRNVMSLVRLGGFGLIGAWAYYFASLALGMDETKFINRALGKLRRR